MAKFQAMGTLQIKAWRHEKSVWSLGLVVVVPTRHEGLGHLALNPAEPTGAAYKSPGILP